MSELVQTGFDYGDLAADKVLECEAAFQTACAIENQATRMIGEQFAKVKENLKFLRNGNGWMEWCKVKLKISHTQAQNYINEFENGESLKLFSTFGKTARWLLVAPTTPQEVRDRADAIAEAGGDISVKAIKQLKADVEAERQARLIAEQRTEEFRAESNERRQTIHELEQRTGQLQTELEIAKSALEEKPSVVVQAPDDYEKLKAELKEAESKAKKLESAIEALKKEQKKAVDSQVNAKLREYQSELDTIEAKKKMLEEIVDRKKAYLDSLDSEVKRIETHQNIIDGTRLELINLAAFLSDLDPIQDSDTLKKWSALAGMCQDAIVAIQHYVGTASHATDSRVLACAG